MDNENETYMTLITFVVTDTIDLDSLVEFEQLNRIISLNIADFVFFPCISAQIKPKSSLLRPVDTENENIWPL